MNIVTLKEVSRYIPMPLRLRKKWYSIVDNSTFSQWEKQNKSGFPPQSIKRKVVKQYQELYNIPVLVETGTYLGDMVLSQLDQFKTIHSIELSHNLYKKNLILFKSAKHVKLHEGDSGKVLKILIPQLTERAMFWLDGHYSGGVTALGDKECPIIEELDAIFKSKIKDHILLIDDARCFNGTHSYPTIKELSNYILKKSPKSSIEVKHDLIRVILKK